MLKTQLAAPIHLMITTKPRWPNPEDSADLTSCFQVASQTLRGRLVAYRWWEVRGPALAAWLEIEDSLYHFLNSRDDFFEGERQAHLPHSVVCYMVGRNIEGSNPTVTICCESKAYCQKAVVALQQQLWWRGFITKYPAFRLAHLRRSPRPRRMGPELGHTLSKSVVLHTDRYAACLYGAPIYGKLDGEFNLSRRATLGGIVMLNDRAYGMTVAHILENNQPIEETEDDSSSEASFSFIDSLDDSSDQEDDTNAYPLHDVDLLPASFPTAHHESVEEDDTRLMGAVRYHSSGSVNDGLDWALVALDDTSSLVEDLARRVIADNSANIAGSFPPAVDDPIRRIKDFANPGSPTQNSKVAVFRHNNATESELKSCISATLASASSFIRLGGATQYTKVYTLRMESTIRYGDCGSWVFDRERSVLLGHIVAGYPGTNQALMVSASAIIESIKASTKKSFSFPAQYFTGITKLFPGSRDRVHPFVNHSGPPDHFFPDASNSFRANDSISRMTSGRSLRSAAPSSRMSSLRYAGSQASTGPSLGFSDYTDDTDMSVSSNSRKTVPEGYRFFCPSRNCKNSYTRQGDYENHMYQKHAEYPPHEPHTSLKQIQSLKTVFPSTAASMSGPDSREQQLSPWVPTAASMNFDLLGKGGALPEPDYMRDSYLSFFDRTLSQIYGDGAYGLGTIGEKTEHPGVKESQEDVDEPRADHQDTDMNMN